MANCCNKCEDPPAVTIALFSDESNEVTVTKCGFFETEGYVSTPPKRYLKRTTVTEQRDNFNVNSGGGSTRSKAWGYTRTTTEVYTPTLDEVFGYVCALETDCEGEGTWTNTKTGTGSCSDTVTWNPCSESPDDPTCNSGDTDGLDAEETSYTEFNDNSSTHSKIGFARVLSITGPGSTTGGIDYGSYADVTLENEDTTAAVIARAETLIEFSGEFAEGEPFAELNLPEEENAVLLRRAKWKVKHTPPITCYLKVWLKKITTPDVGDPTSEDLEPYVWEGTGYPCFEGEITDLIESDEFDLEEPEASGTVTVQIEKYSFLSDYEPEDLEDSGFPTVAEE